MPNRGIQLFIPNYLQQLEEEKTKMWKDKPTGIKILWVWTIGTAAVLLTTVSRTRVRDMEKIMDQKQQQQQQGISSVDSVMVDSSLPSNESIIREDI